MTVRSELLIQVDGIINEVKPPLRIERIASLQQAIEYSRADLWSWELNESMISQGLDRIPIGYLFFGLRLKGEPTAISLLKRFSPEAQKNVNVFTADGDIHNLSTGLAMHTLNELTYNTSAIELGDAYIKGFRSGEMGIFTPFRYGLSLLNQYFDLVKTTRKFYPADYFLAMPHGVYEFSSVMEGKIISDFRQNGDSMTVQEYLEKFNRDEHFLADAIEKIGKVRGLSKMSERMIRTSGIPFRTVGYTPCDFGQVCLADPLSVKI